MKLNILKSVELGGCIEILEIPQCKSWLLSEIYVCKNEVYKSYDTNMIVCQTLSSFEHVVS